MKLSRSSGILLHPTSLHGPEPLGTFGPEAYRFVDFLAASGQKVWQVLPLGPPGYGESPYACFSAVAGNPFLVSLAMLAGAGWLTRSQARLPRMRKVDLYAAKLAKLPRLNQAFSGFEAGASARQKSDFGKFCAREAAWLNDYALFMAIKQAHRELPWWRWPPALKLRQPQALARERTRYAAAVRREQFFQYLFATQWQQLKHYANERGIRVVGDMPIYVAHDSADVWAYPDVFLLDRRRRPVRVSGVPPDFFSRTGQLWGNPVYNWPALARTNYQWWVNRLRGNRALYDLVRFDHFRAICGYWGVPYGRRTAIDGRWYPAPGQDLLQRLKRVFGDLGMIVEDLGMITPDVRELRDRFALPGMKILHYAFGGGADSEFLPHNFEKNYVVYTGTHDNDTTAGWFRSAPPDVKNHVRLYCGAEVDRSVWPLIRLAWESIAVLAIVPMQDILELGSEARMNTPGTTQGNWTWRMRPGALSTKLAMKLKALTQACAR